MLSFDFEIKDLYSLQGLIRLHQTFLTYIKEADENLYDQLKLMYKEAASSNDDLLLGVAPYLEDFLSLLFNIQKEIKINQERHHAFSLVSKMKRLFVQRYALRQPVEPPLQKPELNFQNDLEFATLVNSYMEPLNEEALRPYVAYTLWAMRTPEGTKHHQDSVLFKEPIKKTATAILKDSFKQTNLGSYFTNTKERKGFSLTDKGLGFEKAIDQAHYCIYCHHQKRDSCRKGVSEDKSGCPLDQKISQMNEVESKGYSIGALAIICIDNPLVPATGHRICNDRKKACIFQKQEAVDIPGIESQILKNVLELPYGFELYALLTKWNPLNFEAPLPDQETGHTVLVVGQGPAGFSLAHYLMRSGVQVFAIDGLKIEPISPTLKDISLPIKHLPTEDLETRLIYGFGGVAEYGITSRWDKNNLLIIRLLLERNSLYTLKGGVRLGSQLTVEQAYALGIDHIALCTGAGAPKLLDVKNKLAKGVRLASDFLMTLQLTGAFKENSLSTLSIDLPIVVIGGGLTAIDAATEALAYYPRQVERVLKRVEHLKERGCFEEFYVSLTSEEKEQLSRWLEHAALLRTDGSDTTTLLQRWGGCTVVYRKNIDDAPSCTLNPEELHHAFKEGIYFLDQATPLEFIADDHVKGVKIKRLGIESVLPAKTVIVAVGTENFDWSTLRWNNGNCL